MSRHNVEVSKHHAFWNASDYKDNEIYRELRERHIVTMRHAGHIALHQAVEPPPQPTLSMTADYLDELDQTRPNQGIESVEFAEDWFAYNYIHYMGSLENQELMLGVANNISRQLTFIRGNLVE